MNDVELVKSKLNIVDIVSNHVTLKKSGRNFFGLCPFHQEETPSFSVNEELNIFKCFGCGTGGDVLEFIKLYNNVDFPQALQMGAKIAGVELTNTLKDKNKDKKDRILGLNSLAGEIYSYILLNHKAGKIYKDYFLKRNIQEETIKEFKLGCTPKSGITKLLLKKGYSKEELINFGFAVERNGDLKDKFRGRIIFPVQNSIGEILGFTGRLISDTEFGPKYINSPQTLVYNKSEILYGLFNAKKEIAAKEFVLILEGHMDVLSSYQAGVKNVIGVQGTSLGEEHLTILKRYCKNIYFAFDEDGAGETALIRSLFIALPKGFNIKVVDMNNKKDPDEYIQSFGANSWKDQVGSAKDAVEYFIQKWEKKYDLSNIDQRITFLDKILPILFALSDKVKEEYYLSTIASISGVSQEVLRQKSYHENNNTKSETKKKSAPLNKEEYFCCLLLQNIQIAEQLKDSLDLSLFTQTEIVEILNIIKLNSITSANQLISLIVDPLIREKLISLYMQDINFNFSDDKSIMKEMVSLTERLRRDRTKRTISEQRMRIAKAESLGEEETAEKLLIEVKESLINSK